MDNRLDDIQIGNALITLAEKAGAAIMAVRQEADLGVERKLDQSPVTAADMAAHRLLLEGLPAILSVPIISEEAHALPLSQRRQSCALRTRHRAWPTTADPQNRTAPLRWVRVRHRAAARGTSRGPVPR